MVHSDRPNIPIWILYSESPRLKKRSYTVRPDGRRNQNSSRENDEINPTHPPRYDNWGKQNQKPDGYWNNVDVLRHIIKNVSSRLVGIIQSPATVTKWNFFFPQKKIFGERISSLQNPLERVSQFLESMILPLGTFPWLSLSVIHAKTSLKGLILIILSTDQAW